MNENNHQAREPDTEKRILEASAKVFAQKGKQGARMQDIADEAGINRTLLHYYFRSKDKLFDTVFELLFARIYPAMTGIMSSELPFMERIELFIEAYTDLLRENPFLPVFIFQEIYENPDRLLKMFMSKGFDPKSTIAKLRSEISAAGLGDMDPRHLFANIMGMVLFPHIGRPIFQVIAFQGDNDAYEEFLDERTRHIPQFMKLAIIGAGDQNQKL